MLVSGMGTRPKLKAMLNKYADPRIDAL